MKRALLFSILALETGLPGEALAQIYSQNAVGYVDLDLSAGFNLIGNPFLRDDLRLDSVLPNAPDGSSLMKWDPANQAFTEADVHFAGLGWIDANLNSSSTQLGPYEGAFLQVPEACKITLTGEVLTSQQPPPAFNAPGFYLRSCPLFVDLDTCFGCGFSDPGTTFLPCPPFHDGDAIMFWKRYSETWCSNGCYGPALTYFNGLGWVDETLDVKDPRPGPAEGFLFVRSPSPGMEPVLDSQPARVTVQPDSFSLFNAVRTDGRFTFQFVAEEGASYDVQFTERPPVWTNLTHLEGPVGGGTITVVDTTATDTVRIYRVIKQ